MIVDNVNNRSGAPIVGLEIARALSAPIFCMRKASTTAYDEVSFGVRADSAAYYPLGILLLLCRPRFWNHFLRARVVVCNTSLTFIFLLLSRALGKFTILALHESYAKNLLYRVAIGVSVRFAHCVVTPSRKAYEDLQLSATRWKRIANCLGSEYFAADLPIVTSGDPISVLFVHGSRPYKGSDHFAHIREFAARHDFPRLRFVSTADPSFADEYAFSGEMRPDIYSRFHFILVLTDNSMWRETFGLVGCEAAACGCIPISSDRYAYEELWHSRFPMLRLDSVEPRYVLEKLSQLSRNAAEFERLRCDVRRTSVQLCDRLTFTTSWQELVHSRYRVDGRAGSDEVPDTDQFRSNQ